MSKISDILKPNLDNFKFDFEQFIHDEVMPQKKVEQSHDIIKQQRNAIDIVCKHWLIGTCFRINCPYLHSYEFDNMPLCPTLMKFGSCNREVCVFSHNLSVNSDKSRKECRAYERGFCKYGTACKYKHTRRVLCDLYLAGFCPRGQKCPNAHPNFTNHLKSSSRGRYKHQNNGLKEKYEKSRKMVYTGQSNCRINGFKEFRI